MAAGLPFHRRTKIKTIIYVTYNFIFMKRLLFLAAIACSCCLITEAQNEAYLNSSLPVDTRVKDLITRLTLEEKVYQMMNNTPAIPRLHIPEYDWWNECLHGVARSGIATIFPQPIGMAATF